MHSRATKVTITRAFVKKLPLSRLHSRAFLVIVTRHIMPKSWNNMVDHRSTSADVARLAGVSQSTVSRVFSNNPRISDNTKQKVLQAAENLGYRPNRFARGLITNKSLLIGVVVAGVDTAFAPYILEKFTLKLQAEGYKVLLFNAKQAVSADELLPTALDYQVDGLITTSVIVSDKMAQICDQFETPLVLFNRHIDSDLIDSVNADNYLGGMLAAQAMIAAQVHKPALITGPENTSTSQERSQGFFNGLAEHGSLEPIHFTGELSYESAFSITCDLMQTPDKPDGIFAASDLMALGVLDALRYELGYNVPEDIQVIGFDDIPAAAHLPYQLSTIRLNVDAMIDEALLILSERLIGNPSPPMQVVVPVEYIERKTLQTRVNR